MCWAQVKGHGKERGGPSSLHDKWKNENVPKKNQTFGKKGMLCIRKPFGGRPKESEKEEGWTTNIIIVTKAEKNDKGGKAGYSAGKIGFGQTFITVERKRRCTCSVQRCGGGPRDKRP